MKNIHILPTDKPSRLRYFCGKLEKMYTIPKKSDIVFQNIYITNDEEIKEGDYVTNGKYFSQAINEWWTNFYIGNPDLEADYWKIILTTDQDLIADGVEQISEDTLLKIVEHINSGKNIESFDKL